MINNKFLFEFSGIHKDQIWIGSFSPINSEVSNILHSTNYRSAPNLHQKFDCVWIYESMISDFLGWKILIDESIRLLKEDGYLVVRFVENSSISITSLKYFINSNINLEAEVFWEDYKPTLQSIFTIIFKIRRKNIKQYCDDKWSFAILTQGSKVENVVQFIRSIRSSDVDFKHQIIISGPKDERYSEFAVEYNEKSYSGDYAEISKKKNDIVKLARNSNILIAHDRYVLNADFFSGFEKYGYDFDFLTIKQFYESGSEFPSYCAVLRKDFIWSQPVKCGDYSFVSEEHYLNGGLMIFKKHTISTVPFNQMLFWNQQEDLELSKRMMLSGIVPRINFLSSATTVGISESYTASFRKEDINEILMKTAIAIVSQSFKKKKYLVLSSFINSYRRNKKLKKVLKSLKSGSYS